MGMKRSEQRNRDRLFWQKKGIYETEASEPLFWKAVRENAAYHREHNPRYQALWGNWQGEGIVPVPTLYLKRNTLWTMDPKSLPVRASSSGTSGKRSQVGFCFQDMLRGARLAYGITRFHGILSVRPADYLMLGIRPGRDHPEMIGKTQFLTSFFAPPRRRIYACKDSGKMDLEGVMELLKEAGRSQVPVRIIGLPAYVHFLLVYLKKAGFYTRLPKGSMVLLGGGWKQFKDWQESPEALYEELEEVLGIGEKDCREFFGVTEHPGLYCACRKRHFHVPVYSRALIRDVRTLEILGTGRPGLLNLISPLADGMPLVSILTDDLAVLHEGRECGCGIEAPYFELLGRAEAPGIVTCSHSSITGNQFFMEK